MRTETYHKVELQFLLNFMVTPCINNIQNFNFQLMHTTLKNVELLKHFRIRKTAPTCAVHTRLTGHNMQP
jgi:hypothetical protein